MNAINHFNGAFRFLSNFYTAPVSYQGITFQNNESAFQAQKNLKRVHEFKDLPPNKGKSLGRRVSLRKDWEDVKVEIMYDIVFAKFTQNPILKEKLLATKNRPLIEGNHWNDTFWGVCNGVGRNELGKILMKVRQELKN